MTQWGWVTGDGTAGSGENINGTEIYGRLDLLTETGTLDSIEVYNGFSSASTIRAALYKNGTSSTTPDGASLVEDLGEVSAGATETWTTINSTSNPALNTTDEYWIAIKTDNGAFWVSYAAPGTASNLAGQKYLGSDESADPTNAWDATVANPTGNHTRDSMIRINYTASGGGATHPGGINKGLINRGPINGGLINRSMENINGIWQRPTRILVPVGIQLQGA